MSTPPRLILLPGMDGSGQLFAPLLAALHPAIPATVLSYPPDQALGYAELIALVRASLPRDEPFLILGESFSGPIAISLAASQPPGLQGLLLCCSFARNPLPRLAAIAPLLPVLPLSYKPVALLSQALLGRFATPALRQALKAALQPLTGATMRARLAAVLTVDVTPDLTNITVPVSYLQARQDRVVPAQAATLLRAHCPAMRLIQLDGPHCLLQARPLEAAEVLRAFCLLATPDTRFRHDGLPTPAE